MDQHAFCPLYLHVTQMGDMVARAVCIVQGQSTHVLSPSVPYGTGMLRLCRRLVLSLAGPETLLDLRLAELATLHADLLPLAFSFGFATFVTLATLLHRLG